MSGKNSAVSSSSGQQQQRVGSVRRTGFHGVGPDELDDPEDAETPEPEEVELSDDCELVLDVPPPEAELALERLPLGRLTLEPELELTAEPADDVEVWDAEELELGVIM